MRWPTAPRIRQSREAKRGKSSSGQQPERELDHRAPYSSADEWNADKCGQAAKCGVRPLLLTV
jgi:hypothetical protein